MGINYFRRPLITSISQKVIVNENKIEALIRFISIKCNSLKNEINSKKTNNKNNLKSYKHLIESRNQFKYSNFSIILSIMVLRATTIRLQMKRMLTLKFHKC